MNPVAANKRPWIAGIATAAAGVLLARVVAPSLDGVASVLVNVGGQLLAVGGLFIICLGVRRRIKQSVSEGAADTVKSSSAP